jgi:hypothetical protein
MEGEHAVTAVEILPYARWERELPELTRQYMAAQPYPHAVFDDFLDPRVVEKAASEFPSLEADEWIGYLHLNERKFGSTHPEQWGPTLQGIAAELMSERFLAFLSRLTGIDGLMIDESFEGGGLHQSVEGGFLNVHADFTVHPHHRDWRRRVNLLLYFNDDWPAEFGGDLELWSRDMSRCEVRVPPTINRAVVFTTDPDSFHGHPDPLRCPPGVARRSMALYYFTQETKPYVRSTEYRARPGDGWRRVPIYLDKMVLRSYHGVKRRLGLSDAAASRFLHAMSRLRIGRRRNSPPSPE